MRSYKISVHTMLAVILVLSVIGVMMIEAIYTYNKTRSEILQNLMEQARYTAASLQKNLAVFIEENAIDAYKQLVAHEMIQKEIYFIIIEDYNRGEKPYITGKIRDASWSVTNFDPSNSYHIAQYDNCPHKIQAEIISASIKKVGTLGICMTDRFLDASLHNIIFEASVRMLIISLILIAVLAFAIRRYILKPFSDMVAILNRSNKDGIPTQPLPIYKTIELSTLAKTINLMVASIKTSHIALENQHQELKAIINGVDNPIMVVHPDYNVVLVNDAAKSLHASNHATHKCYAILHGFDTPCHEKGYPCPLQEIVQQQPHRAIVIHEMFSNHKKQFLELSSTALVDKNQNVVKVVESIRDITGYIHTQEALREQKNILHYKAYHDDLTNLPNRIFFSDSLKESIQKVRLNSGKLALLFIDLDHFKEINDSLGHKMGDRVLIEVSKKLAPLISSNQILARLGGDEFTVLMEGLDSYEEASILAANIITTLSTPIAISNNSFYLGCSIGISLYPKNGETPDDLLKYADAAMYKAKHEGRNNFQFYSSEMTKQAYERVFLESNLRLALINDEFEVYYQPQFNALTNKLIGMEALVRWYNPSYGMVSPVSFLPVAIASGFIIELDKFVMQSAMQQFAAWYDEGLFPGTLALNLTIKQLEQNDFLAQLESLLIKSGCHNQWLELEVTENEIMTHQNENIDTLFHISKLGIKIALDDFGTGYSSLSYLKKLPITKLKIDQSFIHDLPDDEEDVAITRAIIALAQNLNLDLIAEGVETEEQRDFLLKNGCHNIQGDLYAKPMNAKAMTKLLHEHNQHV